MADKETTKFETVGTINANAENLSGAPSANTKPVPRKNTQAGPVPGSKANRKGTLERNGFVGAAVVNRAYPDANPQTFRNVRLVPSAKGNRDFYARRAEGPALVGPPFPPGAWQRPQA